MLQKVDKERLDMVLRVIEESKIKFPVATIARELGRGKGEVSIYLSGKKPMSGNFYRTFLEKFNTPKKNIIVKDADVGKEISRLIEITINQQAAINLLMKALKSVSDEAVKKESDRLFDEYVRTQ